MLSSLRLIFVSLFICLMLSACVGTVVGAVVDTAVEVAKIPFKVGGAVVDVVSGDDLTETQTDRQLHADEMTQDALEQETEGL